MIQSRLASLSTLAVAAFALLSSSPLRAQDAPGAPDASRAAAPSGGANAKLRVMAWNIWHGGREDGDTVGPSRVIDVIRSSGADVVAMQETYGSGERISGELDFHFHPRGTNVSILSRYPVLEDLSVHEEFQCVGALIDVPGPHDVAFFSIWLPYDAEIWAEGTRNTGDPAAMQAACNASAKSLRAMHIAIEARLDEPKYKDVAVVIAGDFNSMSHLDYGEVGRDEHGMVVSWPTSHILHDAGFRDAYREANPVIDRAAGATWTPRFPAQQQDRIDFVFHRSKTLRTTGATVLREHPDGFPSDHAALLASFDVGPRRPVDPAPLRVASYNIKHGLGMDGALDLKRIAAVLRDIDADVIALQEVDLGCKRSGGTNQVEALGALLGMHAGFGSFMDYQGGQYGMAMLSRHPFVDVRSLRLPDGNEPRVALCGSVRLPSDHVVDVIDVHFDWVQDDAYRIAQARVVAEHLKTLSRSWILLGDFNDVPTSRTLDLFRRLGTEASKPEGARATIPSDAPTREIDFLFAGPGDSWGISDVQVIDEKIASDHRPIACTFQLRD